MMVRGDRTDAAPLFPLEHEMRFQQLLEADGIPVAARLRLGRRSARVRDRRRARREQLRRRPPTTQRAAVMDEYMGILARSTARPRAVRARRHHARADARASRGWSASTCTSPATAPPRRGPTRSSSSVLGWIDRNPVDTQRPRGARGVGLGPVPPAGRPRHRHPRPRARPPRRSDDGPRRVPHARHRARLRRHERAVRPVREALRRAGRPRRDHAPPLRVHADEPDGRSTPRSPRRRPRPTT